MFCLRPIVRSVPRHYLVTTIISSSLCRYSTSAAESVISLDSKPYEHARAPPIPPPSTQSNHSSLQTFLAYARRTPLSPTSTTYVGTHYEYTCAQTLRSLRLDLTRVGGRSDGGIDLLGTWHLPSRPEPLRVFVQCKALKRKAGPNLVREVEGAFVGAPAGWRGAGILGVLVSRGAATKGVLDAMRRSRWPLVWMVVESDVCDQRDRVLAAAKGKKAETVHERDDLEDGEEVREEIVYTEGKGTVRQVLWNPVAAQWGLQGLGVTVEYREPTRTKARDGMQKELVLTWNSEILRGLDEPQITAKT